MGYGPLADGDYQVRLFFVDPTASAVNQRKFDVKLQGQTVLSNYDIFADIGAVRKAVAKTFDVTASQGEGLSLEFINRTGATGLPLVNAIEITRVMPVHRQARRQPGVFAGQRPKLVDDRHRPALQPVW